MKRCIFCVLCLICAGCLMAQTAGRAVIKLKNGSVVKGEVVGELSDSIAVQGADGSLFIFAVNDIAERTIEGMRLTTETAHGITVQTAVPTLADTLTIETDLLKYPRIMWKGLPMKAAEVRALFADNPSALRHFKTASDLNQINGILGVITGAILGWELVDVGLFNNDINKPMCWIAAGSFAGALGVNIAINNHCRKAVKAYNSTIEQMASPQKKDDLSLSLGVVPGGVGLRVSF